MKRLVYNKFYGGISNDAFVGQAGSVYNAEGVDIHKSSKFIQLSKNGGSADLLNTRNNGWIVGALYESNTNYIEASYDGYLTGLLYNQLNLGNLVTGNGVEDIGLIRNLGKINVGGTDVGFIMSSDGLYFWDTYNNDGDLGLLGADTVADNSFDNAGDWTIGANWTLGSSRITHTAGSTATVSQSLTLVVGQQYRVSAFGSVSAGSCQVKLGGNTILTFNSTTTADGGALSSLYTASAISETLEFVPSSDFVGYFNFVYVYVFNLSLDSTVSFGEYCPFLNQQNFVYVGNGNNITEIDFTIPGVPVVSNVLTLESDYVVRGISKIADQYFIYASNGANGRQYIWNGVDATVTRSVTWIDKPILNLANFANRDYVIIGNDGTNAKNSIAIVNGIDLQELIVSDDSIDTQDRLRFGVNKTNSIETFNNRLLIGGKGGIFSYGKRIPGLPVALVKEFTFSGISSITAMFFREDIGYNLYYYIAGTINGVYGNYKVANYLVGGDSADYGTLFNARSGFIELNPYQGEVYSNLKILSKYTLGYKLEESTQINIYFREAGYANVYTSENNTFSVGDLYTCNGNSYTLYDITYKSGSSGCILHFTYTGTNDGNSGTFSKTSGDGPATFYGEKIRFGYKLLDNIQDTTKYRYTNNIEGTYNEFQFALELITTNDSNTPYIYDFNLYFNEENDD